MKVSKKIITYFLVIALALANLTIVETKKVSAASITSSGFIKANGRVLKNNYGNGDTIYLRGTNAGGYMLQEFWMCPTNYSTNVSDQMDILNVLTSRFGSAAARTLVQTYEANYWTEADFDTCASLGMNCIRLPLWYRNFVDENNNWYSDAFDRVDWFVQEAGERGMYVIIDMHGAYGSQNGSDHSGIDGGDNKLGASEFFFGGNAASNQEKYYQMWEKIAAHFKGNPVVAGYDLLNEPFCTYRYNSGYSDDQLHSMLWNVYDIAYDRIRAIDPDHLIIMEATWDSWDLPNPASYGWSNVMYEYHQYEYSDYDNASGTQISSLQNKINNINAMNYDVPNYMGEFSLFNNISAWEQGLQMLNNNGLNWTTWSYKCVAEYGNWGIVNQSIDKVNVESDSYDTILAKWSNVGSSYLNTNLANTVKNYTPGAASTGSTKMPDNGAYYVTCNGKIVCAENEGNDPLIANRDSYSGAWETFHIVNNGDGTISLKSDINGKYVCAVIDENNQLLARSDSISTWEKFYPVHIQGDQYGLRAYANGKYVKADFDDATNSGQLKAVSDSVAGAWEAFDFYRVGGETETTTAPQEQPTSLSDGLTECTRNENIYPSYWGYYVGDWAGATARYSAGSGWDPMTLKITANGGAAWGVQAFTAPVIVTPGTKYNISITLNSDVAGASVLFKENTTDTNLEQKTLVAGDNTFSGTFTASGETAEFFFDLGAVSAGTTIKTVSIGMSEVAPETTTQAPTEAPTEAPTQPADGYTECTLDQNIELGAWGYYVGSWSPATARYLGGTSLDNFALKVTSNGGAAWGVQAFTRPIAVNAGSTYKVNITLNSDTAGSSVMFKDDITGIVFETKGLVAGDNVFTGTFTAADTAKLFFDFGAVAAGTTLKVTSFSLTEEAPVETTVAETTTIDTVITDWIAVDNSNGRYDYRNATNIEVVNVQQPGFAAKQGVYMSTSDAIGSIKINDATVGEDSVAIQGAGAVVYLDALLADTSKVIFYSTTGAMLGSVEFRKNAVAETTTEAPTEELTTEAINRIEDGIEINGYQVSATVGGMRTVYSVDSEINGKAVVSSGLIYSLSDYVNESEMYVGSANAYVRSYASTSAGKSDTLFSDSDIATSYAMTMKFGANTAAEYNANWRVRAYAQLEDGTYVYTKIYEYKIYDIADILYQGCLMNTQSAHEYLYNNILRVVNKEYLVVDYNWNSGIVAP